MKRLLRELPKHRKSQIELETLSRQSFEQEVKVLLIESPQVIKRRTIKRVSIKAASLIEEAAIKQRVRNDDLPTVSPDGTVALASSRRSECLSNRAALMSTKKKQNNLPHRNLVRANFGILHLNIANRQAG